MRAYLWRGGSAQGSSAGGRSSISTNLTLGHKNNWRRKCYLCHMVPRAWNTPGKTARSLKMTFSLKTPGILLMSPGIMKIILKGKDRTHCTVEPRLSGLLLWSQFGPDYLLVKIKIRNRILFKTTALKSAVKCGGFLLSKRKSSACACLN